MLSPKMLTIALAVCAVGACGTPQDPAAPASGTSASQTVVVSGSATLQRVTPILVVEAIEPVLPFWEALGFSRIDSTAADGKLVFASLGKDRLEIHYQSRANLSNTIPAAAGILNNTTSLVYLTVDRLDPVVAQLGEAPVVIPRRRTSWGADEIYVRDPGGNIVAFAAYDR